MRIVYRSIDGRHSDNPRGLHEALVARGDDVEHIWMSGPGEEGAVPPGVRTVPLDGPEAVAALESADAVVASTHLDLDWTKSPGTTYVQMWHGTPLKAIHRDVTFAPNGVSEELDDDVSQWDLLVTQGPEATRLLPAVFGYEGPVAETGYPDVKELYLASDLLVSDCSSALFDHAVTGKPILYVAHDLEHYRTDLRRCYVDLAEIAPGPVLATSEEVLDAIADLDEVTDRHRDRYARFRERFCPHDDGHAADRVLTHLLPPREPAVGRS